MVSGKVRSSPGVCHITSSVNVVIDWVMKRATTKRPRGISWNVFRHLEDEDFADDLALLSHVHRDMQDKTGCTETEAGSTGLGEANPRQRS